jgi:hypothetical protein
MAMDQYLLIPFLGEWTSIYQLFWCSPGVQGFDTLPYDLLYAYDHAKNVLLQMCIYIYMLYMDMRSKFVGRWVSTKNCWFPGSNS